MLCESAAAALEGADALVVVTEWKQFRSPGLRHAASRRWRSPVIFDGRNIYDPLEVEAAGLAYYGIGRGRIDRGPDMRIDAHAIDPTLFERRVTELETRLAFQEQALAEMSDALAASRARNARATPNCCGARWTTSSNRAVIYSPIPASEPPPPHY